MVCKVHLNSNNERHAFKSNIATDFKSLALTMGKQALSMRMNTNTVASLIFQKSNVLPISHFCFKLHKKLAYCCHHPLPDV